MLGQNADDLLVHESCSLHCPLSGWGELLFNSGENIVVDYET